MVQHFQLECRDSYFISPLSARALCHDPQRIMIQGFFWVIFMNIETRVVFENDCYYLQLSESASDFDDTMPVIDIRCGIDENYESPVFFFSSIKQVDDFCKELKDFALKINLRGVDNV